MVSIAWRRNGSGRRRSDFSALADVQGIAPVVVRTSDLIDAQEVPCRETGFTLRDRSHGLVVGGGRGSRGSSAQTGGGRSSRGSSVGEQFGHIEGHARLGWVQGHTLERLNEVVDFGLGVGVLGDRHDR